MAKDFSFLFYPGEALRDTQFFSLGQKGCYLTILTSHIENIRFSYDFLMKITRQLNDAERTEFLTVFTKDDGGYFLDWAVTAIEKRAAYLVSRGSNKLGKTKDSKPIGKKKSYENHMVNKNKNRIEKENKKEEEKKLVYPFDSQKFMSVWNVLVNESKWKKKSFAALQTCLKQLSKYPHDEAVQMMENSIAGGWQGLFEIKNNNNGNTVRKGQPDTADALEWANKVLSDNNNSASDTMQ